MGFPSMTRSVSCFTYLYSWLCRRPVVSLSLLYSSVFGQCFIPFHLWVWCTQVYCYFLVYHSDLSSSFRCTTGSMHKDIQSSGK